MKLTGSQALLESLIREGVKTIFGYPGGAIMPIYDALYDYQDKLHHILVRHEQAAAHAAEGFGRVTGEPGVCFATSGPGATNLVTGIADAMMDSVPMVAITGQVHSHLVGTDAFQEADVIGITAPITKWNYQVTKAQEIPEIIAKAFHIARTGRPGPVLIDITKDAQFDMMDFSYPEKTVMKGYNPNHAPNPAQIAQAAELLNSAKKPYILFGHGIHIAKAYKELQAFSEKGGFPVAATLHGLTAFPTAHKNYVGYLGMHGNYGPNFLANKADVVLAVGMRFDDRVTGTVNTYLPHAKIIHIDIDPAELNKNMKTEVPIVADAKSALAALTEAIKENNHDEWIAEFRKCDAQEAEKVTNRECHPTSGPIKMAEVVCKISDMTNGEAILVADVGQHQMVTARYYKSQTPNSYITSGGMGTMGFSLPAAMGAKVAAPDRQVISVSGDGGFQMNIQELATIAQEQLPVKIIILNNNFLGMVRQWQQMFFEKRYSMVNLKNPDFIQVAKGFYIDAEKVETRENLEESLQRLLDSKGPRLLEIVVEKEGLVFPMIPTGCCVDEIRLE